MKSYDLLVIGGGSAGLAAVLRAQELSELFKNILTHSLDVLLFMQFTRLFK